LRFAERIVLPDGAKLATLRDAIAHLVVPNSQRNQFDSDELAEERMKRYLDISQSWKTNE
jgi:hypothetical protein